MTTKPRLIVIGGVKDGHEYLLDQNEITLGRRSVNVVQIDWDVTVSRTRHARIVRKANLLFQLEDLGSTAGTFLTLPDGEEEQLSCDEPRWLWDGAQIRLGKKARFQVLGLAGAEDIPSSTYDIPPIPDLLDVQANRIESGKQLIINVEEDFYNYKADKEDNDE